MAYRYGYITFDQQYSIAVFNKIFETRITNYFITKKEHSKSKQGASALHYNIVSGDFDMEEHLKNFAEFFNNEIFPTKEKEMLELEYRILFLTYLKALLNGAGHYHYESRLNDEHRMDLVVNYGYQEYILELKRIFAKKERTEGLAELIVNMSSRRADVGYYVTFDLKAKSEPKARWLSIVGKRIFEVNI